MVEKLVFHNATWFKNFSATFLLADFCNHQGESATVQEKVQRNVFPDQQIKIPTGVVMSPAGTRN